MIPISDTLLRSTIFALIYFVVVYKAYSQNEVDLNALTHLSEELYEDESGVCCLQSLLSDVEKDGSVIAVKEANTGIHMHVVS